MMGHYNFIFENGLSLGYCAARRMPCDCQSCLDKLNIQWVPEKIKYKQYRSSQNKDCVPWKKFQDLNDWMIIEICKTCNSEG